jgi:rare lipoprotein A
VTWAVLVVVAVVAAGCATAERRPSPPVVARPLPETRPTPGDPARGQVGKASWYGDAHHGKKTASGERYDKTQLTAAHRTLPLGTRVRVTNVENDRSVVVRINDRGPFVDGRIIDLSHAAAREIGSLGAGVVTVRVEVLPDGAVDR